VAPVRTFADRLDAAALQALESIGTRQAYRARTVLVHQGDPSRHVVLILEGWVKVAATARSGQEALLAIRGPGDIVGEMSAVDGRPRSATVRALTPVRALAMDGGRFLDRVLRSRTLATALLVHLAGNLRHADSKRLEYVSSDSSARLAGLLLELCARHGRKTAEGVVIDLPLSQRELATGASMSREAVGRVLRKYRERDVVITRRNRVIVVRPEVLRSLHGNASLDA
jgi:CRP/FNR family transcriptional regulator, cyclic AMP receptor protein